MGQIPLDKCINYCDLNERCKSISYSSENSHCYLKDKVVDETTPQKHSSGYSTYYSVCEGNLFYW